MAASRREFLGLVPFVLIGGPLILPSLFGESDPNLDPDYLAELERVNTLPVSVIPDDKYALLLDAHSYTGGVRIEIPKGVVVEGLVVGFGQGAPEWKSVGYDAYIKHVDTHPVEMVLRQDLMGSSRPKKHGDVLTVTMHQRSNFRWQAAPGREVVFRDRGGECLLEGEIRHGSHLNVGGWWL